MSTEGDTLTRVVPEVTNEGDHDKFQHYFRKSDIENNILNGTPMTALCGKILLRQSDPLGKTVCPECKDIYETNEKILNPKY